MKKFITLIWLALTVFTIKAGAQTTTCNADFTISYLTNYTVKFTPAVNDSPLVHHLWVFGDGTPNSTQVMPIHTYSLPGTYFAVHTVIRYSPNNVPLCTQSITRTVIIQEPCNLVVNFSWTASTSNPLMISFQNLSTPLAPTDSIIWNFGDGTPNSNAVNPVHTYANAGTYTVCLIVKKNNNAPGTSQCIRYICKTVVVHAPCNLVANFSWTSTTPNPLTIAFQNLSTPLSPTDSITWTFGDGSGSTLVSPTHTYTAPGTYVVCLRIKKVTPAGSQPCVREICKTVIIPPPCNLVVNFSWSSATANPLVVTFQNLSTPLALTDSIKWTFGDGSTSNAVNPVHTYANAGTYVVCLTVKKHPSTTAFPCIKYICKTITVIAPCNLVANFTWLPDAVNAQKIWFTNTSVPINITDSIRWTFGDGSSSNVMNPNHTYAQPGTYTVCLRVQQRSATGTNTGCVREICKTITVHTNCNFQPSWTWRIDSFNLKKVHFTNTTISPTANATATWSFGDGTFANTWNAVHEYAQPGRYYVCLKVQISNTCFKYSCDSIYIPPPPPPCHNQSNFTFVTTSTNSQTYTFIPAYQSSSVQYIWTFGDGTGSQQMVPTHHYAQGGTYTVCLTVWRSATCASTSCKTITVQPQFNCNNVNVSFTYHPDPHVPNKLYFTANSNYPILDQTWTFTRLPNGQPVILHQNNPSYIFPDTGYYRVCLRAVTFGGCIKEYCSTIHIAHVPGTNVCNLQVYPNPVSTMANVNITLTVPEMIHAYVYNSANVLVAEKHQQGVIGVNLVSINVSNLPAGLYKIKFIYGNKICYAQFQKL